MSPHDVMCYFGYTRHTRAATIRHSIRSTHSDVCFFHSRFNAHPSTRASCARSPCTNQQPPAQGGELQQAGHERDGSCGGNAHPAATFRQTHVHAQGNCRQRQEAQEHGGLRVNV